MTAAAKSDLTGWHITQRVVAAVLFGYILTNTAGVLISYLLPFETLSAVAWPAIFSWVLYLAIVMWVFSVRRLRTVWLGLAGGIVLTTLGAFGLYILEYGL